MRCIKEGDAKLLKDFEFANMKHFSRYAPMQEKKADSMEYWKKKILEYLEEFNKGTSVRFLPQRSSKFPTFRSFFFPNIKIISPPFLAL